MKRATLQLETLTCPSCMQKIENAVKALPGVEKDSVTVSFNSARARVHFDESLLSVEAIEKSIRDLGYEVKKSQVKDL